MLREKLMSWIGFFILCFWGISLNAKDTRTGYVNNNGVDIYWTDTGRGKTQTIFLIHGFPLSGEQYKCQIEDLQQFFRIVTIDLRGFGKSGKNASSYTNNDFVSDVQAVVSHLGLSKFTLGGFSLGSVVAELYTLRYPQNVKSLLLLSPFYGQILNLGSFELGIPLAALAPLLPFLINGDAASFDSAFIDIGLPETCPSRKEVKNFLMNMGSKSPASIQLAVLGGQNPPTPADQPIQLSGTLNPFCSPPVVPQINVPTLIIYGGQDSLTNRQGIEALRQAIPNSQLYEVPGGHFITITQSEKVDRAIFSFLIGKSSDCHSCF